MLYLKFMDPNTHRMTNAAATPANMFALCHVCGAEVNVKFDEVLRNRSIWGSEYMCPACLNAFIEEMCDDDDEEEDLFDDDDEEEDIDEHDDEECEEDEEADERSEECHGDESPDAAGKRTASRSCDELQIEELRKVLIQEVTDNIEDIMDSFITDMMQ